MRTTLLSMIGLLGVLSAGCGGSTSDAGLNGSGGQAGASGGSGGASGGSGGATGGSAGVSGAGGSTGGSGGSGGAPECTDAKQCTLFSDCCTCVALGPNDPEPPVCPATCIQDACSAMGITQASCQAGSCVAGVQCVGATCESIPPTCEPGQVPSVIGSCWGPCVPVTQCAAVPSCAACSGPLQTCVVIEQQTGDGPSFHCVDIPKGCEGTPNCECMGDKVCPAPFDTCIDMSGVKGMTCSCPNC
jgi:hypothetical protein